MISLRQDTEYMTNIVSASPVPAGKRFFSFSASNDNVGIISHGDDGNLYAVFGDNGSSRPINLKETWRLDGTISCFRATQCDGRLWIAVTTTASGSRSRLRIIHNVQSDQVGTYNSVHIVEADELFPEIHDIHLSDFTHTVGGYTLPQIYLAMQPWNRITKEDQLAYCNVSPRGGGRLSISLDRDWGIAANPKRILGVQLGTCSIVKGGAFVLYETFRGKKRLQFRSLDKMDPFTSPASTSDESAALASFQQGDSTVFVVAGEGITLYDEDEYTEGYSKGIPVKLSANHKVKTVHTAQNGDDVTLWYQTKDNAVYYLKHQAPSGSLVHRMKTATPVQLLGPVTERVVSPLCSKAPNGDDLLKVLMTSDGKGNIVQHSQASDTQMWESQPLYATANTANTELDTMTIRLQVGGIKPSEKASKRIKLFIESSAYMRVVLNGSLASMDKAGQWFEADSTGVVNIIVPTADLSSHNLHVTKYRDFEGKEHRINDFIVRPMDKVVERMAKYETGAALKNAKATDGTPIIRPGQISDEEADKAAKMFGYINKAHQDIKNGEAKLQGLLTASAENPDPFTGVEVYRWESDNYEKGVMLQSNIMDEDEDMALLAQFAHNESELNASGDMHAMGLFDSPWDIFPWLLRKLKKAVEQWETELKRVAEGVWKLIVTWADAVWSFALDTAKAIGKAAVWVFEKIKLVGKALYEFVGLVFDFGFVKDWSNSIGAFVNAGLDAADDKVASSIRSVLPDFFKRVEDGTQEAAEKGPRKHSVTEEQSESKDTGSSSISQNWAMDQFQHGGGLKLLQDDGNSNMDGISPSLIQGIERIKAIILELGDLGKTLGSDVWDLIQGKCSFETFMQRVGSDIGKFVLKAIREIASKIIDKISHVAQSLKSLLNRKLFLPIFSFLWRKLTGKELTILTLVSLLLGWPAAAFHKAALGDRAIAPRWEGHLNKDNFEDLINNKVDWADAALTVKPFFESLQLVTTVVNAITSFLNFAVDTSRTGKIAQVMSIIDGGVGAVNVLVNLPLGPDRSDVPGIPRNYILYLSLSAPVIEFLMEVFKWRHPDSAALCHRISTTWSVAVGLVIFGNEVFVEGWLITRHGRIDRLWVGIQNEILKLLDAGASSVSAWTMDNNPEAALLAEAAKLPYAYARTALQLALISYNEGGVGVMILNDSYGVQGMAKGGVNTTKLTMIEDGQGAAGTSISDLRDLTSEDGLSEKRQLQLPAPKKDFEAQVVEEE